jgi:signal transduction histidine kinase
VLTNLVSNAVKFSPPQSEINISAETVDAHHIKFSVADHGPGIPEGSRGNLFTAFHQVDSSDTRAKGGTGLGLAICKGIVERHGGSIGFDSVESGGSVFWFELPLNRARRESIG